MMADTALVTIAIFVLVQTAALFRWAGKVQALLDVLSRDLSEVKVEVYRLARITERLQAKLEGIDG